MQGVGPLSVSGAHAQTVQPDKPKIDPGKLLVRQGRTAPVFLDDPLGWVNFQQRAFTAKMQKTMRDLTGDGRAGAAWTLILLSLAYGVFHAAGPGHGKAVISAWLLANERQLRRGVVVSFMAAFVQGLVAVALVSGALLLFRAAGSAARDTARFLEAGSYGLITAVGCYLLWQAARHFRRQPALAMPHGDGRHHDHDHDENCGCGHAHLPAAGDVDGDWSWGKAASIAVAVGLRPCSGAIVALLAANALGIYWAGVASTFAMAFGVAVTVSAIAMLAVTSRGLALKLSGGNTQWMDRTAFGLRLAAGLVITWLGAALFWNALNGPSLI